MLDKICCVRATLLTVAAGAKWFRPVAKCGPRNTRHVACGMWHAAFAYFGGQAGSHLSIGSKRCNKGTGNTAAGTNICKSNGCHSLLHSCHAPKLNNVLGKRLRLRRNLRLRLFKSEGVQRSRKCRRKVAPIFMPEPSRQAGRHTDTRTHTYTLSRTHTPLDS